MTDYLHVELLVDKLARPTMVMRFARADINRPGAQLRYSNACQQIEEIVKKWGEENDTNTVS